MVMGCSVRRDAATSRSPWPAGNAPAVADPDGHVVRMVVNPLIFDDFPFVIFSVRKDSL